MLRVGTILHQAKSGRLIVRLSKEIRPGVSLLDEKGRRLGRVIELIGPTRSPYASVAVATSRVGNSPDIVYLER